MIAILFLSSCHKDSESEESSTPSTPFIPTVVAEVQGNIVGYVYDLAGNPVEDAVVYVYSGTATTNEEGVFTFTDQNVDGNGTYVRATKDGYILGSDYIYPNSAATTYSYVQMLPLTTNTTINTRDGGTVPVINGGTITFRGNSIVGTDGDLYTGTMQVTAYMLNSDDPQLGDQMPGGLYAIDAQGSNVVLGTYGMMAVELRDPAGNELQLSDNTSATLTMPIADNQKSFAPEEIKLWSFDEVQGVWIEEGMALRDDDNYIAEVTHFSFWNCDAPFPLVQLCGTVVYEDGSPVAGASIRVNTERMGVAFGWTDDTGTYCGKMPKGVELTILVFVPGCSDPIATITRGPYFGAGDIEPIVLTTSSIQMSGAVTCAGSPQPGAQVLIRRGSSSYVRIADENGNFDFELADDPCGSGGSFEVFSLLDNGQASATVTVDASTQNIELDACPGCPLTVEIINELDACNPELGTLTAQVTNGSGNYTYLWDNGQATDSVRLYEVPGMYCVDVTDLSEDCSVRQCYTVVFDSTNLAYLTVGVSVGPGGDCQSGGQAEVQIVGGTPPYTIEWSLNQVPLPSLQDQLSADDLATGFYQVVVTDAEGCSQSVGFSVSSDGLDVSVDFIDNCETADVVVSAVNGTPPYNFELISTTNSFQNESGLFTIDKSPDGEDYSVFVTDANGCMGESGLYIPPSSFVGTYDVGDCQEFGLLYPILLDSNYQYRISDAVQNILYDDWGQGEYLMLIAPTRFEIVIEITNGNCSTTEAYGFARFDGLEVTSADNGTVEATVDLTAPTRDCQPESTFRIISTDFFDVTSDNGNLSAGDYYVVVQDSQTGCVVAIESITLN